MAILLVTGFAPAGVTAETGKHFEPSVSEAEAAVLKLAATKAEATPLAAAALITEKCTPESSAALPFAAAVFRLRGGEEEAAVLSFQDALKRMPDFHRARLNLAKLLLQLEHFAEAAAQLRLLLQAEEQDQGELWRLLGYCLLQQDHPTAAETAYRQALVWLPGDSDLMLGLLKSLLRQGRTVDIVPLIRRCLSTEPEEARWWRLLVNTALEQGDYARALVVLECARQAGTADSDMLAGLGDLYADQDMHRDAARIYEEAAETGMPPKRLLRAAAAMLASKRPDEAERLLTTLGRRASDLLPEQTITLQRLSAQLALDAGKTKQGRTLLRQVLAANPLDGAALLLLADSLAPQAPDEAVVYYQRAEVVSTTEVQALLGLARVETRRQRYAEALSYLRRALILAPDPRVQQFRDQVLEASRTATSTANP